MIATFLQDSLIQEVKKLFKDEKFQDQTGACVPLKVYAQNLPLESNREDEDEDFFPYVIIKLDSGEVQQTHDVKVIVIMGIYDDDQTKQGHRKVLHLIDGLYERFAKHNVLDKGYIASEEIKWSLQEEDTHPYYFGGMEMTFTIPAVRRENQLA